MNETMRTLVVDDHPLFASATKSLLDGMEGIEVVGVVSTGFQCMEQVAKLRPDLVFLDYNLPDLPGTDIAAELKKQYPELHIVIFTGIDMTDIFDRLIEIRVSGVLSKESSERTIRNMVNCILDNQTMLPMSIFHRLQMRQGSAGQEALLDEEEVLMMNMLVKGATHEQIADSIHMSKRTVDNYLRKIYAKLGANSRLTALEKFITSKYYT